MVFYLILKKNNTAFEAIKVNVGRLDKKKRSH